MEKIFIACPISKYIDGEKFINNDFKIFIEALYNICQKHAPKVFLALRREEYGKKLMKDTCTELDFKEMLTTDLLVAIPEDSKGTAVEIGWASYMGKKILLILNKHQKYTPLISGLKDIADVETIWYNGELDNEVLSKVDSMIQRRSKEYRRNTWKKYL